MEETKDGASCDKSKCCGKALIALLLVGVGFGGGYFCGKKCGAAQTAAPIAAPTN